MNLLFKAVFFPILSIIAFASAVYAEYDSLNLDAYYEERGYYFSPIHSTVNEGYTSKKERAIFTEELRKMPYVKKIAEVGFNTGHSAEAFLEGSNNAQLVSFDINDHYYTEIGVEFFNKKYKNRFRFVAGDSAVTVPQYFNESPRQKFDLIFIDGDHSFDGCLADIKNFQKLAYKHTILWIDDYDPTSDECPGVKNAVNHADALGIIKITKACRVYDDSGLRFWAEARYLFND